MNGINGIYKTIRDYKGKRGIWGIALLIVLGVILLVAPGLFLGNEPSVSLPENVPKLTDTANSLALIETELASQISSALNQVEGAGAVTVSVSLETGYQQEYVRNITQDASTIQEQDNAGGIRNTNTSNQRTEVVFTKNGGEALVAAEKNPAIRGVLVVAEGAGDSEMKMKLSKAVQTLLNVPAHRVMVITKKRR